MGIGVAGVGVGVKMETTVFEEELKNIKVNNYEAISK